MRNSSFDTARFFACFFIVAVHIGYYNDYSQQFGEMFRALSRWALPFFFLISGYFIGIKDVDNYAKRINKLIWIFIVASVIFIPYAILKKVEHGPVSFLQVAASLFSVDSLVYGNYFHLWFLPSLITGMLLTRLVIDNFKISTGLTVSLLMILLTWVADVLAFLGHGEGFFYYFRFLLAFPLVFIGWYVAKIKPRFSLSLALALLVFGFAMIASEMSLLRYFTGYNGMERQFPLFSAFVAIVLLLCCANVTLSRNLLSDLGEKYSLGIYLFHPLFLPIAKMALNKIQFYNSFIHLVSTFLLTILFVVALDKLAPRFNHYINGSSIK